MNYHELATMNQIVFIVHLQIRYLHKRKGIVQAKTNNPRYAPLK